MGWAAALVSGTRGSWRRPPGRFLTECRCRVAAEHSCKLLALALSLSLSLLFSSGWLARYISSLTVQMVHREWAGISSSYSLGCLGLEAEAGAEQTAGTDPSAKHLGPLLAGLSCCKVLIDQVRGVHALKFGLVSYKICTGSEWLLVGKQFEPFYILFHGYISMSPPLCVQPRVAGQCWRVHASQFHFKDMGVAGFMWGQQWVWF